MFKVLNISSSPYIHSGHSVPSIMREVILALVPVVFSAVYFFGLRALILIIVSLAACLLSEHLCQKLRHRPTTIGDGSAIITGILLALILPPAIPLWVVAVGGVVAIIMGEMVFGGLGQNKFNPALVGRAFLQAAFPVLMTTWSDPVNDLVTLQYDAVTQATPLAAMKFQYQQTEIGSLFWGNTSGSLGETSSFAILIGGMYLVIRRIADWRIVVGVIGSAVIVSGAFWLLDPTTQASPLFHILSGGFALGTFFMATDMVASPTTPLGRWWYALGIGSLVILIRVLGGLPEGMMYAILLMNAISPLIQRYTQHRIFGAVRRKNNRSSG